MSTETNIARCPNMRAEQVPALKALLEETDPVRNIERLISYLSLYCFCMSKDFVCWQYSLVTTHVILVDGRWLHA